MAEKKYMDWSALVEYDSKIKSLIDTKDAAKLAEAKKYADDLAVNYDAAGAAATAESNAKGYTDGKVTELNGTIAGVKTIAEQGVADAATAQAAAEAAQADVDALEILVGELPSGTTATSVVDYVNVKTAGIATDAALAELQGQVSAAQGEINTIKGDYLKGADKTELSGLITAEEDAREAADSELSGRLDEVEAFFKLAEGEKLDTALDTLVEIQTYLDGEGKVADQMLLDIAANTKAIEDEAARAAKAEGDIEAAYKAADEGIVARLAAVEAELGEGEGSVAQQIAAAVAAEAALRESGDAAAEASAAAALKAAQDAQGEVDALEGVVSALDGVVAGKVAQGDHDALAGRVTTAEGKITTLEGASHTHANADVLDGITASLIAAWNGAVEKQHEHANADVLAGISSAKVSAWDAAEGNAKAYTDEKIGEFVAITTGEVDSLFQ